MNNSDFGHYRRAGLWLAVALLSGSGVRKQLFDVWAQYKWYVMAGVTALVVQLVFIVGLAIETRRRKASESAVKSLSGRIIAAAEEERRRIARELHDDIAQRLCLISVDLDLARVPALQDTVRQVKDLVNDIHDLSHRLHSRKLQLLGLEDALKEVCQQLSRQHHLDIRCSCDRVQSPLKQDVALCFYRVAQEALNNCVKYSGSSHVDVTLSESHATLRMAIRDYGSGFDPDATATGIGLATMEERLRLVGGTLRVESQRGAGTEITAEATVRP